MVSQKVILVTGAASPAGQKVLASLVAFGYKVLALGEPEETFFPDILQKKHIKVTTALPVTAALYQKYDIEFCFGDISDISFLASIFNSAENNGIEIEYVIYLSASSLIQKGKPSSYHPDYAAAANIEEVSRAYWQEHKKSFKGFFYAADVNKDASDKVAALITKTAEKYGFPAEVHRPETSFVSKGERLDRTPLSSLYRFVTPFKLPESFLGKRENSVVDENDYLTGLLAAISLMIEKNSKEK